MPTKIFSFCKYCEDEPIFDGLCVARGCYKCGKRMNFVRMTQEEYDLYKNEIEQKGMRQFRKDKLAEGLLKLDYWESK